MAYGDLDYSGETYEQILQRMLARVPGDIDKREGSIIYDALAPAAVEISARSILAGSLWQTFGYSS